MVAAVRAASTRVISDLSWVVFLTVGALLARIPLAGKGLWRDEGYTYFDVISTGLNTSLARVRVSESNPPLYFLGMYLWTHLFGFSEWVLQLPSLILGVAVVPLTYTLGRTVGTARTGAIAAILALSSYELVQYSLEARPYALATVLCGGASLLFCRYLRDRRLADFAGSIGCMIVLVYTHYDGPVFVGAVAIAFVCLHRVCKLPLRWGVAGFGAIVLATMPLWDLLRAQTQAGQPWAYVPSLLERPTFLQYTAALALPIPSGPAFAVGWLVSTVFMLAIGVRLWRAQRRLRTTADEAVRQTATTDLFLGIVLVVVIIGMAMLALFEPRYLLPFLPLSFVYCAYWIESLSRGALNHRSYAVALALAVINLSSAYREFTMPKSGIRALVHELDRRAPARLVYLVTPDYSGSTLGYYVGAPRVPIHGFATWDHPEVFALPGYAERWRDPQAVAEASRKIAELAGAGSTELDLVRIGELSHPLQNSGNMRYSRADAFIEVLRKQYRVRFAADYSGSAENASLIVFDLRAAPAKAAMASERR